MKNYIITLQFQTVGIPIKARNKREAIKKIREKYKTGKMRPQIDVQNTFIDEAF